MVHLANTLGVLKNTDTGKSEPEPDFCKSGGQRSKLGGILSVIAIHRRCELRANRLVGEVRHYSAKMLPTYVFPFAIGSDHLPLPYYAEARRRRHGRGLQGGGHATRQVRCPQIPSR